MIGSAAPAAPPQSTRAFWIAMAVGTPIVAFGIRGALVNARDVHPGEVARWLVGSAIVHDAVILPLVLAVGLVGRRFVPAWAWPAVRWALMTTGVLVLVSRPFVAGYGYNPGNPTALNRNYGLGVSIALAVVWTAATVWAFLTRRRT